MLYSGLRISVTLRPSAACRRLTDILSPCGDVIGQYAACRFESLWFFGLMCGDSGSTVSFLHAAFLIYSFVRCILLCAFCVVTDAFSSLYVDEFLIAACGVSPLRGRPAIAQAPRGLPKGWTPTLFSLAAGLWCCALEMHQLITAEASLFTNHYSLTTIH